MKRSRASKDRRALEFDYILYLSAGLKHTRNEIVDGTHQLDRFIIDLHFYVVTTSKFNCRHFVKPTNTCMNRSLRHKEKPVEFFSFTPFHKHHTGFLLLAHYSLLFQSGKVKRIKLNRRLESQNPFAYSRGAENIGKTLKETNITQAFFGLLCVSQRNKLN